MKNRQWIYGISRWMITVFLPVVLLLSILQIYAFNKNFYLKEFQKYNVPAVTKIKTRDLEKITIKLINYLKGKEEELNIKAEMNGKVEEVFGEREKQHMKDVKILFSKGFQIRNFGLLFIGIALGLLLKGPVRLIYKSLFFTSIISLLAVLLLFVLIQMDFYRYFTYFHQIFFTNDLWLLNPETDVLIQMLPLEFFADISIRILGWFIAGMSALAIVSFYKLR